MIYNSIDIIPAKLFFKILETGEIELLSNEKCDNNRLQELWSELQKQQDQIAINNETNKVLQISKRIETLSSKYEAVKLAVKYLSLKYDDDLVDVLKGFGYKFTNDLRKDLERIARENKAIELIISRLQKKLPKVEESNKKSLDNVIMTYAIITELGFIDSNKITLTQYYALIEAGNQKIKALENGSEG